MIPVLFFTRGNFTEFVASNTPQSFASVTPSIGAVQLFALTLGAALWVYTDPSFVQRFLSARDRTSARRGAIGWIIIIYPWWILMGIIGVYGNAIVPDAGAQTILIAVTESAFPSVVAAIVVTAVFAGTMSTADSQMNVISAMLVNDVYKELRPGLSDTHYLRMARGATILAGGAGVVMAPLFASSILVMSLNLQMIFISGTVPAVIVGVLWSGVPERAGFYSSLLGGGVALVWILVYGTEGLSVGDIAIQAVYPGMTVGLVLVFGLTFIIGRDPPAIDSSTAVSTEGAE
jgi:Na+/proline symporter